MELKDKTTKYNYNQFKEKFETMMNAEIKPVPVSNPYMPPPPPPMAMGGAMYYAQPMMATTTATFSSASVNNNNNNFNAMFGMPVSNMKSSTGAMPKSAMAPMMMQQRMVSRARAPVAMDAFNLAP